MAACVHRVEYYKLTSLKLIKSLVFCLCFVKVPPTGDVNHKQTLTITHGLHKN